MKQVCIEYEQELVPGRLVRRYKRFLADVELESGEVVTVHCPNSGSMLGCIEKGAPVRLSRAADPRRKTRFTWEMIHIGGGWVGTNTTLPNRLAALAARERAFGLFHGAENVRSEVKVSDHSRLDLACDTPGGPLFVEVKNVTLVEDGVAIFPDSVTTRGAKHLGELARLKEQGNRAAMLFIIQRMDAGGFAPAEKIDPTYASLYAQVREAGVEAAAVQARVEPGRVCLIRELPLLV